MKIPIFSHEIPQETRLPKNSESSLVVAAQLRAPTTWRSPKWRQRMDSNEKFMVAVAVQGGAPVRNR